MRSRTTDMTKGDPVKLILVFAIPALIGNIFQQVYNLADSAIVGRFVGPDALAAVGASSSICFLFFALCNGIGSGGGIIVSQFYGAHDDDRVKKCIVNTGFIMLLVPLFFGTVSFLSAPLLLQILKTPADILPDAVLYVRYMAVGILFVSLYNFMSAMLRALGDSRSPLFFLVLSTIVNIGLDILFVCQFQMGIEGAALATVIAQFISAFGCIIYAYVANPYFRIRRKDIVLSANISNKVIRLGVPMSLQFALIASMALQRVVNSFGTTVVAAFTATNRIEQLIHQPYGTLAAALATFCGQNYGAGDHERVATGYRKGMQIMLILTVAMTLTMQLFGGTITSLFVEETEEEVIALGAMGLRITSLFYPALGLIYVVRGVLTGMGDAFFALFNGIVEVIGRFTVPIFLTDMLGFGARGIWISSGIVWVLSGVTAWLRYYLQVRSEAAKRETDGSQSIRPAFSVISSFCRSSYSHPHSASQSPRSYRFFRHPGKGH